MVAPVLAIVAIVAASAASAASAGPSPAPGTAIAADVTAGTPREQAPPLPGTILGWRRKGSGPTGDLLTLRPDGSNVRVVASGIAAAGAAFSPDGRRIAFAKDGDVFVMPATGGAARRVVSDRHDSSAPAWSPNGRYLAYSSRDADSGRADIFRVTVDSPAGSVVRLTSAALDPATNCPVVSGGLPMHFATPAWEPKGRFIAAVAWCGYYDDAYQTLVYLAPRGNRIYRAFAYPARRGLEPSDPEWSPDGSRIAWTNEAPYDHLGYASVHVMATDGDGRRQLVPMKDWDDEANASAGAVWAPTGQHIAYNSGGRVDELRISTAAGTKRWRVVTGIAALDWKS